MQTTVEVDDILREICQNFDYAFDGTSTFIPPVLPEMGNDYGIGLIVGPSGSGKSTMLASIGTESAPQWQEGKAIASHFDSVVDAQERLAATGLNSIPAWTRPYSVLSTGERFRADMARKLASDVVIDEFTSVIDRNVAKSCSNAIKRYVDTQGLKRLVFATCHYDVAEWLRPDWIFDTATQALTARGLERPSTQLELLPCGSEAWAIFSKHHYLDANINKGAHCWLAFWAGIPVGFTCMLAFPNAHFKNAWREHRTVILPDFQGLGFGVRLSDAMGEICISDGKRYFSKTAHPRMGDYRDNSIGWRPTSKNHKKRRDYFHNRETKESGHKDRHAHRLCYSHEYIGAKS